MTFLNTARGPSLLLFAALALAGCTTAAPPAATPVPAGGALPAPDAHNHDVVLGTFYGSVDETGFHISAGDANAADGVAGSQASLDLLDPVDAAGFGTSATPSGTTFVALKQTATTQTIPTGAGGAWNVTNCGAVPAGGSCTPILLQNLLPDNELEHSYVELDIINPMTPDGGTAPTITCRSNAADDSGYGVTVAPGCLIRYPDRLARAGVTSASAAQLDRSSPIFWVFTSDQPSSRFTWKATVKARLPSPIIRASLRSGTTDIPSGGTGYAGGTPGAASSGSTRTGISADGRYVVFQSAATNLDPSFTVVATQVYRRDNLTGTTSLVSLTTTGTAPSTAGPPACTSTSPNVSDDGSKVVFLSNCHLDPLLDPSDSVTDVYVRDISAGTTTLVSVDASLNKANINCVAPTISPGGTYVAYSTGATNMFDQGFGTCPSGQRHVWVFDLSGTISPTRADVPGLGDYSCCPSGSPVPCVAQSATISDAQTVAFQANGKLEFGDTNGVNDIYLYDFSLSGDITTRVSVNESGALLNAASTNPALTGDGNMIAYQSTATNILLPNGNGSTSQIYLATAGAPSSVVRVSRTATANSANGPSTNPVLDSQGRFVAFVSTATNLDPADTTGSLDVYFRDMATPDTAFQSPVRISISERAGGSGGGVDLVAPGLASNSNFVSFGAAGDLVGSSGGRQVYRAPTF